MARDKHDHILICNGIDQGIPMWDLVCQHQTDDDIHHHDHEGEYWEDCLVQSWWDEALLDIIHSTDPTPLGLGVVTTWHEGGEPLLRSVASAEEWKESKEY